jgi:hypothetical protein
MLGCGESFATVLEIKQHFMKCHSKEKVEEIKTAISNESRELKPDSMPKLVFAQTRPKVLPQPAPVGVEPVNMGLKSLPSKESLPKVGPAITTPRSLIVTPTPSLPTEALVSNGVDRPSAGETRDLPERSDQNVQFSTISQIPAVTTLDLTGTAKPQPIPNIQHRPTVSNRLEDMSNGTTAQIQQPSTSKVPTLTISKSTSNITPPSRLTPSIQPHLTDDYPSATNTQQNSAKSPHPLTSHQTPPVPSPVSTVKSPEIPRQSSTTKELAQQRAIAGTKSITSYFSPSPSLKVAMAEIRSAGQVSVNLEERMERLGDVGMPIILDEDGDDLVDVPADDVRMDDASTDDFPADDVSLDDSPADDFPAEIVPRDELVPAVLKRSLPTASGSEGDVSGRAEKRMRLDSVIIDDATEVIESSSSAMAKVIEMQKETSLPAQVATETMDSNRALERVVATPRAQDWPVDYGPILQRMGLTELPPRIHIPDDSTPPVFRDPLSLLNHIPQTLLPSAPLLRAPASPAPPGDLASVGQNLPDHLSESSDTESFDDYDPYFDTHDVAPQIQLT